MKLSFRYYGKDDNATLEKIRQIPNMHTIVSAIYDVEVGKVWQDSSIKALKNDIEKNGMHFEVVESVPVHEDIKMGLATRDEYIENYCTNIKKLAKYGVKCICYNFMPVFDWTRTQLDKKMQDGSTTLIFDPNQLNKMDPLTGNLALPGWDASYKKEELKDLFDKYSKITEEDLWNNLEYFLKKIIPVAAESGINMAIHPDDPPYSVFGLPRIITSEKNIDRFLKLVDDVHNGLTFCTGSLGCCSSNDVVYMVDKYSKMGRIHFMHIRNVLNKENGYFEETSHLMKSGSLDIVGVVKALKDNEFNGYIRPDHGRMIWGETGRAGYGLYDRALGATYINGLWDAI